MNGIIGLKEANCKGCYKCIRNCPVKSIAYKNEQTQIIDGDCIYCGKCLLVCPQNAKYIESDLPKIKHAIANGEKMYASIAPSYIAAFPDISFLKISNALKKLGFAHTEETAIGAERVTREYEDLIRLHKMDNIITSACPSVNLLIEKYYPQLVEQLAPVVTPAVAHARMIRKIYGVRSRVVFIGPCISKKYETVDPENGSALFGALTYAQLKNWMEEQHVLFEGEDQDGRTLSNTLPRFYPAPGGIIRNLHREERKSYECISVDGGERCVEVLDSITNDGLTGYLIEMNICAGGCLGGPVLKSMGKSFLMAKGALAKNVMQRDKVPVALTDGLKTDFCKTFKGRKATERNVSFSEEQIHRVLDSIGKTTPEKELNCGCCGYNTCREKAIAVLQKKADIHMCVPYMRELAESMSNTVVEHCPIGILILNDRLHIEHINPAAKTMLHVKKDMTGCNVATLLESEDFYNVYSTGENIIGHKQAYKKLNLIVEQTIIMVQDSKLMFVLIKDITEREKMHSSQQKMAEETAMIANEVMNRQMRVIQEIADLLGETTTETKIALSRLTKFIIGQDGAE